MLMNTYTGVLCGAILQVGIGETQAAAEDNDHIPNIAPPQTLAELVETAVYKALGTSARPEGLPLVTSSPTKQYEPRPQQTATPGEGSLPKPATVRTTAPSLGEGSLPKPATVRTTAPSLGEGSLPKPATVRTTAPSLGEGSLPKPATIRTTAPSLGEGSLPKQATIRTAAPWLGEGSLPRQATILTSAPWLGEGSLPRQALFRTTAPSLGEGSLPRATTLYTVTSALLDEGSLPKQATICTTAPSLGEGCFLAAIPIRTPTPIPMGDESLPTVPTRGDKAIRPQTPHYANLTELVEIVVNKTLATSTPTKISQFGDGSLPTNPTSFTTVQHRGEDHRNFTLGSGRPSTPTPMSIAGGGDYLTSEMLSVLKDVQRKQEHLGWEVRELERTFRENARDMSRKLDQLRYTAAVSPPFNTPVCYSSLTPSPILSRRPSFGSSGCTRPFAASGSEYSLGQPGSSTPASDDQSVASWLSDADLSDLSELIYSPLSMTPQYDAGPSLESKPPVTLKIEPPITPQYQPSASPQNDPPVDPQFDTPLTPQYGPPVVNELPIGPQHGAGPSLQGVIWPVMPSSPAIDDSVRPPLNTPADDRFVLPLSYDAAVVDPPSQPPPTGAAMQPPRLPPAAAVVPPPQPPLAAAVVPLQQQSPAAVIVSPPQPPPAAAAVVQPPQPPPAAAAVVQPPQPPPAAAVVQPPQPPPAAAAVMQPPQPPPAAAVVQPPQPPPAAAVVMQPPQPPPAAAVVQPPQPPPAAAVVLPPQPPPAAAPAVMLPPRNRPSRPGRWFPRPATAVLQENHENCTAEGCGRLAIALANQVYFGPETVVRSSVTGKAGPALDPTIMATMLDFINRNVFPLLSKEEFEKQHWRTISISLGTHIKHKRQRIRNAAKKRKGNTAS